MTKYLAASLRISYVAGAIAFFAAVAVAQSLPPRIRSEVVDTDRTLLSGSAQPIAQAQNAVGRLSGPTKLTGMTIHFKRSAEQEAELKALVAAQQDPGSPQYRKWLTPDQFAARFGVSDADLNQVGNWLQAQGFTIDSIARSRNAIRFSGSVAQIEKAFQTEMRTYAYGARTHYAPSTSLSLPSAIEPIVQSVGNLTDFRAQPHMVKAAPRPAFTSSTTGNVYFSPGDIAVAYSINSLYSAGYTGAGQSIAILGQSAVDVTDVEKFQSAASFTVKDPTLVLVPGTGTSSVVSGDEAESDLDLEWSGGIATGAKIFFVYTGSSSNNGVFDAFAYAVEQKLGNIISLSYGACETALSSSTVSTYEAYGYQAISQGQTLIASSGDDGSSGCYEYYGSSGVSLTNTQLKALAVNYPASSQYFTALGGTEIPGKANTAYITQGDGYWEAKGSSDEVVSLIKYPTESAWNDDSSSGLSASGGGVSVYVTRPSWQTGVTGVSSGSYRLVPDISGYASASYPGFVYCSSDSTSTGISGSCSNKFRDTNSKYLTVAGGTSFAAPIFAGMAAILNQARSYTEGYGLYNKELYALAATSSYYSSAFHDLTTGGPSGTSGVGNECTSGTTAYCSTASAAAYYTTTGYDQATGLGSVDLYNLYSIWPTNTAASASLASTLTTITASPTSTTTGSSVKFTIAVTDLSGTALTGGTVDLTIDGGSTTTSVSLGTAGSATYTTTFSSTGTHQVIAAYEGSTSYAPSKDVAQVAITSTTTSSSCSTTSCFTLSTSPSSLTIAQGGSGSSTVTITSKNSYAGTLNFKLYVNSSSDATAWQYGCYDINDHAVTANSTATTTLTIYTSSAICGASGSSVKGTGQLQRVYGVAQRRAAAAAAEYAAHRRESPWRKGLPPVGAALAGLLLCGLRKRRVKWAKTLGSLLLLLAVAAVTTSCSMMNSSSSSSSSSSTIATTTTVTPSASTATTGSTVGFTIAVASNTGSTVPTGNVALTLDSSSVGTATLSSLGSYTYSTTFSSTGTHTLTAAYQGDSTHSTSSGSGSVTVSSSSSSSGNYVAKGTYTLALYGYDSSSSSIYNSTSISVTVD